MAYKEMTIHEKLQLCIKSLRLREAGQLEEANRVWNQVPLAPYLAKWCKASTISNDKYMNSVQEICRLPKHPIWQSKRQRF